ncbi:SDR family NAD(P)-dependent oxidoreductase [Paludifilum halophilum]|uniref:Ketoreductase domain-containing protein n=1 Tax=Paludifilum halophilum TaxID=1642702 RepID=A0A235B9N3_9BACL|nr:SDR family oxidoreductase [Paludifilum halophilum]OYD08932.1 hypothetical protein CHM34_03905 [Paludifilum halophilum]
MNQRIVLLTGASSGIGKEIARQLVQRGDFPILVARKADPLKRLTEELGSCDFFPCDVTQQKQVHRLAEEVIARYGRVDVLINNAGYGRFGGLMDLSISDYEGMMETNYLGTVRLTRAVLPHMFRRGAGRIINIASVAGLTGSPNLGAYSASKFALIGFSESLRLESAPLIQVGVLCPGPVQTPFFRGTDPSQLFPGWIVSQLLDAHTVARYAVRMIDRPRLKVIPRRMSWAVKVRNIAPEFYMWATKKMYESFQRKKRMTTVYESNGPSRSGR